MSDGGEEVSKARPGLEGPGENVWLLKGYWGAIEDSLQVEWHGQILHSIKYTPLCHPPSTTRMVNGLPGYSGRHIPLP